MQITAVVGTHDTLSRHDREQQQDRLLDRRFSLHHLDAATVGHLQASRLRGAIKIGMKKPPCSIKCRAHVRSETNCCPANLTSYLTTPGGVPSVKPITVSRHRRRPWTRMNSE